MKKYIYFLVIVGFLLCIATFYRGDLGEKMALIFAKHVIREKIEDNNSVWFKYAEIDSLYEETGYKYFLFVKHRPHRSEDIALLNSDSTLIVQSYSVGEGMAQQNGAIVCLADSAFPYLLNDNQDLLLCVIDSVVKSTMNSYQIRKYILK